MDTGERTRDIYEQIAGYPKPPVVPLPEPDDLDSLEQMGLRLQRFSRGVVKATMAATGFRAFQKQLPNRLEDLMRRHNIRGAYLFAPVVSATLVLEDDPRHISPIERAATLVFAARSLYEDITSARLAPDEYRGQVLEMGQYPNLFSTCLIVEGRRSRIFKSANVSQITVALAGRLYALQIGNPGSGTTIEQLQEALAELVRTAEHNQSERQVPGVGLITGAEHITQLKAFTRLQRIGVNAESLSALRHSFLTLCLDLDSKPSSQAEAAMVAHIGNCGNRWYHSSLQLIVFGNAMACALCNFSTYLDGNTMMRAASELCKRGAAQPVADGARKNFVSLPPAKQLDWEVNPELIQLAQKDLQSVQDNQQATFEIQGIGRSFFTAHNLEPVPAFILALQMTARRLTGKMAGVTQFLTMSRYRCMDLVTADVTTPEVTRFVDYLDGDAVQRDQAMALMQEAVESHAREYRKARRHLPLDEVYALYTESLKGFRSLYVTVVTTLTFMLLRILGFFKPTSREIIVSHPEIYPEVPIVGRPGIRLPYVKYFGLHYQILEDKIVVTVMPSVSWSIPNTQLIAELHESLKRIQSLL
jgi:hypothetical protein